MMRIVTVIDTAGNSHGGDDGFGGYDWRTTL